MIFVSKKTCEFWDVMFLTVKSLIIRDDEEDALVLTRVLRDNILYLGHAMTRGGCTSVYFSGIRNLLEYSFFRGTFYFHISTKI